MSGLFALDNWVNWNVDLLPPGSFDFDVLGAAIESPRSLSGTRRMADFSGGGFVSLVLDGIPIQTRQAFLAWNRISSVLSAGGLVIVPIITSFFAPPPTTGDQDENGFDDSLDQIAFSDGAHFSDGSRFVQSSIVAALAGDHAQSLGTIMFTVTGALPFVGGEVFSIWSGLSGWRAHRLSEPDSAVSMGSVTQYQCGIQPPLRSAIEDGTLLSFYRPPCMMQLAPGERMPLSPSSWWDFKGTVKLVEAV